MFLTVEINPGLIVQDPLNSPLEINSLWKYTIVNPQRKDIAKPQDSKQDTCLRAAVEHQ